eukprot:gnl/MRDRNA2_/MRDRNA2_253942_c0_seq1.p1 gnl/MRDRNA2_/MRDRNA2_253942_c0~~gnl/MRDRNA2_/MRDRNA2_253942_c0_seq1.p1  ORF type:complete len:167 (+),score=10.26 gnl/MRDRNA2_/MRDRNA2_253942_c0_seq1:71-502(+)
MAWAPLEVGVDFIQPALFALGMTWLPLDLSWWGNTTLGCYVFHFYFKDHMCLAAQHIGDAFSFDPTGLLTLACVVGSALTYTTVVGPIGHYFLLLPTFVHARVRRALAARSARVVDVQDNGPVTGSGQSRPGAKPLLQDVQVQ